MKAYRGKKSIALLLGGSEWSAGHPGLFTPGGRNPVPIKYDLKAGLP